MLGRMIIGTAALLSLTACTSDLDDPIGVKKRRAEERRAECSQIYEIKQANYEQGVATYAQEVFFSDTKLTQAGFLKRAENHLDTARALETLELSDKNLRLLNSYLAESFRHQAKTSRDLAPFAEVERTITAANERSSAHQAVLARANPYEGLDYAIEVYCEGGNMPSPIPEISVEQ